ncbi:hypothetical protein ABTX82_32685 [Streptomyces lavendulae]|uniref:hypothetical protein n=1 Tax=Streptomyces lavendulae TaxID=1914 RepID=UPI0033191629
MVVAECSMRARWFIGWLREGVMGERETWMTEEFGASHEGAVEVLLADGVLRFRLRNRRSPGVAVECL